MQQPEILRQLHNAHLGTQKTKLLARDTVYWLNINTYIDRLVQTCNVCQEHQPSQTPEPLHQHGIPSKPWSVLGTDLFEFEGHHWLIIADYYTKYPIIRQLPHPSPSSVVVNVTKQIFAEFGIPDIIVSDNGPHFGSEPTVISHGRGSLITSQPHLDGPKETALSTTSEDHQILAEKIKTIRHRLSTRSSPLAYHTHQRKSGEPGTVDHGETSQVDHPCQN